VTTYRVRGAEQLRANLLAFPKELAAKALGQALAKGAVPFRESAQARAPRGLTGKLAAAIAIARDRKPYFSKMDARYVVFVKYKGEDAAPYWRYVEFGTAHSAPQPYMRPAFETQKENALQIIFQSLSDAVPRIASSLSK
jgi:HK97 gp10 family phage protein